MNLLQYEKKIIEHVLHSKAYMVIVWGKIKNIDGMYCKERIIDDNQKKILKILKHYIFQKKIHNNAKLELLFCRGICHFTPMCNANVIGAPGTKIIVILHFRTPWYMILRYTLKIIYYNCIFPIQDIFIFR